MFYAYDPQGNVAQRTDDYGQVLSQDLYDAYGTRRAGNPGNDVYGYNGQWGYTTDTEAGLILCTYRYYDPVNARWLTRDPIGYDGGVNLYGYVGNNPVTFQDALGQDREECIKTADKAAKRCHDGCARAYRRHHDDVRNRACQAKCRAAYYFRISACYGEEAADATFDWCSANRKPIAIGAVVVVGGIIIIGTGGAAAPVLVVL